MPEYPDVVVYIERLRAHAGGQRLKRVRIGQVRLGHLPVGQWRYLAPNESF